MAAKISAVASKISAARELARRLAEEKQAAGIASGRSATDTLTPPAENGNATRAEALARALKKAETTRDSLQRLKAENEALRDLLVELASDKAAARNRINAVEQAAVKAVETRMVAAVTAGADVETVTEHPAAVAGSVTGGSGSGTSLEEAPDVGTTATPFIPEPEEMGPEPEAPQIPVTAGRPVESAQAAAATATPSPPMEPSASPASATHFYEEEASMPEPEEQAPQAPEAMAAALEAQEAQQQQTASYNDVMHAAAAAVAALPAQQAPAQPAVREQPKAAPQAPPEPPKQPAAQQQAPVAPPAPAPPTRAPTPKPAPAGAPVEPQVLPPRAPTPQQARGPESADRIMATPPQLQQLANLVMGTGQRVSSIPPQPVAINGPVRVFYNRVKGPLPPNGSLVLKLGLNRWDGLQDLDMKLADHLPCDQNQEWWEVVVALPAELFRVDFVVYDKRSGAYDNNQSKDFQLQLAGAPSEEELLEARLAAFRAWDEQRVRYLEAENARLWRAVEMAGLEAASLARIAFRQRREAEVRAEAAATVSERRRPEVNALQAADRAQGVFAWTTPPIAGKKAFLAFNKHKSPLEHSNTVRVHVGYDGWWNQVKQVYDMALMPTNEVIHGGLMGPRAAHDHTQQWYGCLVDVPHSAAVLDFVFSDRDQRTWDNNNMKDFHTRIQGALTNEELTDILATALRKESAERDQEGEDRAAKRAQRKAAVKGEALKKRRSAINTFLYTVPYMPAAGQKVEVYYNPDHTPLRGRPNIYMRAGWNRWSLAQGFQAAAPMSPTLSPKLGFWRGELTVPEDAWGMDLMFIDTNNPQQATGFFDNNGGLDYHFPVARQHAAAAPGGALPAQPSKLRQPLRIVHVAVEMAPIAKVGGMGDVVTALGRAVQEEGHAVEVILPKFDCINYNLVENLRQEGSFSWGGTNVRVWRGMVEGLPTTFLEPENGHVWRGCIYGRNDDHVRFGFHCGAALQYLKSYNVKADILHCHDWQSAPIAWGDKGPARTVFTIHNLSYGADLVGRAMAACDVATTVSPTYATEISGSGAIAPHLGKLYGIRNGIDADVWDPANDPHLPMAYGPDNAGEGKWAAKRALRQRLGLSGADVPIVACVTRLVAQKGIHLIKHAAWKTLERGGQYVLLGSAPDPKVQGEFNALAQALKAQYHDRVALVFQYDEPLSHLIYAGSDMFLVPSMFEPCGLTQMIAMQYGAIPIVRKTGGLADTVFDVDHDEDRAAAAGMETNGFVFESTDAPGMDYALNRALNMWYSNRGGWGELVGRAMRMDWSWFSPALDYIELYYKAMRT